MILSNENFKKQQYLPCYVTEDAQELAWCDLWFEGVILGVWGKLPKRGSELL